MGQFTPEMETLAGRVAEASSWAYSNPDLAGDGFSNLSSAWRTARTTRPGSQAHTEGMNGVYESLNNIEQSKAQAEPEFDPAFGNAACDCAPGEPCCLRAFEVEDESDSSRKIAWPVAEGKPSTLFIIAKDPYEGSPAGKVNVSLTDYEACKNGFADNPGMLGTGFANAPGRFQGDLTQTMIATVPFHIPSALSAFFPKELLIAIYVIGYYTLYSAYDDDDQCDLSPIMCMSSEGSSVKVQAIPHLNMTANVTGRIAVTFAVGTLPTLTNSLTGTITGEFGNQKLELKKGVSQQIAPQRQQAEGPVRNPVLGVMGKIFEKISWMSETNAPGYNPSGGIPRSRPTSITVAKTLALSFEKLELKGKSASPDLQLTINPASLRIGLSVTGVIDLLDLLINRVPGIAEAVRDTRSALENPDNPVNGTLICDLTLGASGGLEFGVQNALTIAIGNVEGWETEFDKVAMRFQADAKINGELKVAARVGVNTWFFDGAAGVEGSVSTAWHFGGRQVQSQGKKVNETLYFFEGLVVKGRYYVELGRTDDEKDSVDFNTGNDQTRGQTEVTRTSTNVTRLVDNEFTETFFASEGTKDDWKPVA